MEKRPGELTPEGKVQVAHPVEVNHEDDVDGRDIGGYDPDSSTS